MSVSQDQVDRIAGVLRRRLMAWFRREARVLPWRQTVDPYAIWVSEIMLQQTRVEAVLPYYLRFMEALPTVQALAEAHGDRVLKLWEGLGYYSRARNLHRAARVVVERHDGQVPRTVDDLLALPGIGRYTAGAIASFAFNVQAPIVDGNIKRVLARLFAIGQSIDEPAVQQRLWHLAERLVPPRDPRTFNQALMELGAVICVPRRPRCLECPVQAQCGAYTQGLQERLPKRTPKRKGPHYEIVAAVVERSGAILLGRRPGDKLLGGLWEFPGGKVEPGETREQALRREVREECGLDVAVGEMVGAVDHAYSHFSITLYVYRCTVAGGRTRARWHDELRWVRREDLDGYAFPAANRKILPLL